ncbi:MAG: aminotransferase class V-fold PLP-dependent enzyme [Myxococcota bacterium]
MKDVRSLFRIPDDVAYLNHAYMAPELRSVAAAAQWGLDRKAQPWTFTVEDFFEPAERVRRKVATVFGSSTDDIALAASVSYGIETAVINTPLSVGDNIVLLDEQFPSNVYPWREAAQRVGACVRMVPRSDDQTDAILGQIDDNTAAVSVAAIHWTDGQTIDLVRLREAARAVNALLVLDLTQSLGVMPFDLARIDPDFAVAAGYKWLLCPYATAYLYVAPRHQDGRPLEHGWITRDGAARFSELVHYREGFAAGARRFDMGERSNFITLPMSEAALDQLLAWGIEPLYAHLSEVNQGIAARAQSLGVTARPLEERAGHYLGLTLRSGDPNAVAERLKADKIFVSVRGRSIRVTPHMYTTPADIDRFFEVLETSLGGE